MFALHRSRGLRFRVALLVAGAFASLVLHGCSRGATKPVSSISAPDLELLAQYESVRAALANDDVRKAHVAGEKLLKAMDAPGVSPSLVKTKNAARILAESYRIDVLRSAFKEVSAALVPISEGVDGYFIVTTDLVTDGVWVQTTREVSNPYLGRSMALYGEIKK
jgi:hypothetical protein